LFKIADELEINLQNNDIFWMTESGSPGQKTSYKMSFFPTKMKRVSFQQK